MARWGEMATGKIPVFDSTGISCDLRKNPRAALDVVEVA
jgi:hypothetical protein